MTKASELILNEDGSVYHLHLKPEQIADTIITVGDPKRVDRIIDAFDTIEHQVRYREFYTVTGRYKGKRISVISTGIGPDNIDIVINELDALRRFELNSGKVQESFHAYTFVRMGTTGTAQADIKLGSIIASEYAIGLDNLLHYYLYTEPETAFKNPFKEYFVNHFGSSINPVITQASSELIKQLDPAVLRGITVTCPGFYAPQGRSVSLQAKYDDFLADLSTFRHEEYRITNFEMETNAIYGLSSLLGHKAISLNSVLANRATGEFTEDPTRDVDNLIDYGLSFIESL